MLEFLHLACVRSNAQSGHVGTVKAVLAIEKVHGHAAASVANETLQWAAFHEQGTLVPQLLALPPVQQATHIREKEALKAAAHPHAAVGRCLLNVEAVRAILQVRGNEVLCWAACHGHEIVVAQLSAIPTAYAPAHRLENRAVRIAARQGHDAIVKMLLEIPAVCLTIHAREKKALRWAIPNGHVSTVLQLLRIEKVHTHPHAVNTRGSATRLSSRVRSHSAGRKRDLTTHLAPRGMGLPLSYY